MKKRLILSLAVTMAAAGMAAHAQSILVNSWENSQEGWVIDEGNWTSGGFSTTTGVTAGTYSWILNAANAPDYGAAITGPASTGLAAELANAASVSVDMLATGFTGLSVDLVVNQGQSGPFGLGYQSADGYDYTGSPTIGTESTLTWTIPASFRQALQDNPTLAANLVFQIGYYTGGGGTVYLDNLRITPLAQTPPTAAPLSVRETWDGLPVSVYPGYQTLSNDLSSAGFSPSVAWYGNPAESGANGTPTNTSLISIRDFISKPIDIGIPTTLALDNSGVWSPNTPSTMCQDNSGGPKGVTTLWTSGDWMVRPMTQTNAINFNVEGQYWFSFTYGDSQDAIYAGEVPSSGAGGIGIADGADTNAHFVSFGITATNLYLGPANAGNPWGTIDATKSIYISQGTLGQPGNPNSLIYSPANDPVLETDILPNNSVVENPISATVQTNFTGGPYYVDAFGTNRQGQAFGNEILVLARLTTHSNAPATMDAKFYTYPNDQLDTDPNSIVWDCSYSFTYTNTMAYFLVYENGEFPFDIYSFHAGTTLASVVGIDPGFIAVTPLQNTFVGDPLNFTCYSAEAASTSSTNFPTTYTGTLNYQWYQNGKAISGATAQTFSIASASLSDSAVPAGTDAGTYTCVSTDSGGFWGAVTSAPVVVTVVPPVAPQISTVRNYADLSTIQIAFNEPVTGADNVANYTFSGGIAATSAVVVMSGQTTFAQLRTTRQAEGTKYTVSIGSGIMNQPGQSVSPNTATYWSMMEGPGVANFDAWSCSSAASQVAYYNSFLVTTPFPFVETNETLASWDGIGSIDLTLYGTGSSDFGGRQYGWFVPPVTTNYVFFIACDDGARLSLSTDADPTNLCVIAAESLWSASDEWTNMSDLYPTGPHRGDGSASGVAPANGGNTYVWDNSAAEQNPATADDQNRSDNFIVAYNDSVNGSGNWPNALSQVTDVVPPGMTNFWPQRDANGQAQIHLVAGQKYFMQCDYVNFTGGYNLTASYKFAGATDPASPSASLLTATSGTMIGMVQFAPSVSAGTGGNGKPVINFTGTLQSATNVTGPYSDVSGATSPYTPTGATMFFRAHD